MALWAISAVFLWTLLALFLRRCPRFWRGLNRILCLFSMALILYGTVFSRSIGGSSQGLSLLPFASLTSAHRSSDRLHTMMANVLLFVPYGLTAPFAFPRQTSGKAGKTILSAMLLSILIEAAQFAFRLGYCESDDVLMNTLGAAFGCLSYMASHAFINTKSKSSGSI